MNPSFYFLGPIGVGKTTARKGAKVRDSPLAKNKRNHDGHKRSQRTTKGAAVILFAGGALGQYDDSMGFSETIFLFFLALLIFGPKKLPEIARMVGKAMNEFKRASYEFRSQIESEISNLEVEKEREILPPAQAPAGAVETLALTSAQTGKVEEAGSELQALPPLGPGQIPYAKAPDA